MTGCGRSTEVVLICFGVESPDSLENIPESGRPEKRFPLFQRANHHGGEQEGSAQRPAHATAQMTTKQNRDYDRLRPQHRGRPHLLRRRVARLPGEHPGVGEAREAVPPVSACQPSRRGTKGSAQRPAHATAQMTTKQNRDYDRLRPQHRGRPHLLRRRVARLPGEHPGVGEAREAVPLFQRANHHGGEQKGCAQRPAHGTAQMTAKQNRKDYDRLRPQHRGRPHLLRRRVARLPGEHPGVGEAREAVPLFQRANHHGGEQEGSAQRPAHATAQMTTKQNRDYDRLRPQHRGRASSASASSRPTPWRTSRSRGGQRSGPPVSACQPSRRGTKRICATTRARYSADDHQAEQGL
ncbi:hypothetical protein MTO96_013128 [Rhipicephalus appendiculatus]